MVDSRVSLYSVVIAVLCASVVVVAFADAAASDTIAYPKTRAGEIARAYFEAFNSADAEKLRAFEQTYRSAGALEKRSVDDRIPRSLGLIVTVSSASASVSPDARAARFHCVRLTYPRVRRQITTGGRGGRAGGLEAASAAGYAVAAPQLRPVCGAAMAGLRASYGRAGRGYGAWPVCSGTGQPASSKLRRTPETRKRSPADR